jgi:L-ribulose-5-phosphate 3-epimerase UlaE
MLLKSALRELEVYNQNKTKIATWTEAILIDAKSVGMDLVEELIAEVDQMEG